MNKLKTSLRLILAVIGGSLLGNTIGLVLAFGIDSSYGYKATGGGWPLSWPNILYTIGMSLLAGFFAGFIAKRRGKLVGALAQFVPMTFVITASLILNRDILGVQDKYQTRPALWTWIGLIPAIIGGAVGEYLANDPEGMDLIKRVRWHWLWVWIPLVFFLYSIAGSIRFMIADFVMAWEILFIPRLWILYFGLPVIVTLFYFTFSLPATSTMALLGTLAHGTDTEDRPLYGKRRIGYICLWAIGVPLALTILWWIDTLILGFLLNQGLKIP